LASTNFGQPIVRNDVINSGAKSRSHLHSKIRQSQRVHLARVTSSTAHHITATSNINSYQPSKHKTATTMRFTPQLLPSRKGALGIIELNNPRPLHALTQEMIHAMTDIWNEWSGVDKAILVKSSTDTKIPAFCAGGDVKACWEAGHNGSANEHGLGKRGVPTADFFRDEYTLNYKIATNTDVPQVSLWNGIVMGGGAGISVHGKYRVATEATTFSMPETAIGLFCDVGSTWWMPRKFPNLAMANYVALTGARLKPEDLMYTGLATHYVRSERMEELETALVLATEALEGTESLQDCVAPVLMSFHEPPPIDPRDSFLAQNKLLIDCSFAEESVEAIVDNLNSMDNAFSQTTLVSLAKLSPTSLKVTLEGLRRGADCETIGDVLQMEYRMSQAFMKPSSDFYEGIRAVLIDKDHLPAWSPAILEEITPSMVESYFEKLAPENEWEIPTTIQTTTLDMNDESNAKL
jgi:enoyl-CoA hydratase/carnithine racemase